MKPTPESELRTMARLRPWGMNPRDEDDYKDIPELMDSLSKLGQLQPVHVWETPEVDWILIGHRRFRAMSEMGWTECRQVVHHCADERDALEIVLSDHGHTVTLNPSEKITAAQNALRMGMGVARTAAALGVNDERVQLWFQLGDLLPAKARAAMGAEKLSMNTAEVLLKVDKEQIGAAVQLILSDPMTGQPMSHGQAVTALESQFIRPAQWRRAWQELEIRLKKKLPVIAGYQYVSFDDRRTYTMGETGQPEPGYEFEEEVMPKDVEGRTFGARARELGVPIYVVPAPRHEEKYVLLVNARMLRDVQSVARGTGGVVSDEGGGMDEGDAVGGDGVMEYSSDGSDEEECWLGESQKIRRVMGAIDEKLRERPAAVMTTELWEHLVPFAASQAACTKTVVDWLGNDGEAFLRGRVESDSCARAALRWVFLFLLCQEDDASSEPLRVMSDVADHLGVDVERLVRC